MKVNGFIMSLVAAIALLGIGCGGGSSNSGSDEDAPVLKAAKLLIEHNATDEDTGFQCFADGDPWNSLTISDPAGQPIVTALPQTGLVDFGLTEFFFETSEPENAEVPIDDVLARLSEGEYTFTGEIVEAGDSLITTDFSHRIPAGPTLLTPVDGSTGVDPSSVVVSWEPVLSDIDGAQVDIVGYQVIVEEDAPQPLDALSVLAQFSHHLQECLAQLLGTLVDA